MKALCVCNVGAVPKCVDLPEAIRQPRTQISVAIETIPKSCHELLSFFFSSTFTLRGFVSKALLQVLCLEAKVNLKKVYIEKKYFFVGSLPFE